MTLYRGFPVTQPCCHPRLPSLLRTVFVIPGKRGENDLPGNSLIGMFFSAPT
jgi:hypothetical protein